MTHLYEAMLHSGRAFAIRPLGVDRDLDMVWRWWNAPHVAGFWSVSMRLGPARADGGYQKADLKRYLDDSLRRGSDHRPVILVVDGVDVGYLEEYRVGDSLLKGHAELADEDRGFHVMIGEPDTKKPGFGPEIWPQVVAWQRQTYPRARRVALEPSVANAKAISGALKLPGARRAADVQLPHKLAALIIVE